MSSALAEQEAVRKTRPAKGSSNLPALAIAVIGYGKPFQVLEEGDPSDPLEELEIACTKPSNLRREWDSAVHRQIAQAAIAAGKIWPAALTNFLLHQLGKEGLLQLIKGLGNFVLRPDPTNSGCTYEIVESSLVPA